MQFMNAPLCPSLQPACESPCNASHLSRYKTAFRLQSSLLTRMNRLRHFHLPLFLRLLLQKPLQCFQRFVFIHHPGMRNAKEFRISIQRVVNTSRIDKDQRHIHAKVYWQYFPRYHLALSPQVKSIEEYETQNIHAQ